MSHIFSTELYDTKIEQMFNEKDWKEVHPSQKEVDEEALPWLCDLHLKKNVGQSPYDWITEGGKLNASPVKFFFCAKHENTGKIESHLWFYKGFCAMTNPVYCQMIDAGTICTKRSISYIIQYMEKHKNVGGAAGEIEVFEPSSSELG